MPVNEESRDLVKVIDGNRLKKMFITALKQLKKQQSLIDSLNVFPVPDGDTGTNMYLTFLEAVKKMKKTETNRIDKITSDLSKGALMGARGNSGVILSQLLRGFATACEGREKLTSAVLVASLKKASQIAYQGVLKPVEGTILTVSKKAGEGAELALENDLDLIAILQNAKEAARKALNRTPEQLPALKEAGVVDAGGQGYLAILEGMLEGLSEQDLHRRIEEEPMNVLETETEAPVEEEIKYIYDTQILLQTKNSENNNNIKVIRNDLQNYGDSLIVVGSDNIIKIHIHSNHPGIILEYALKLGSLNEVIIENMKNQSIEKKKKEEHTQLLKNSPEQKQSPENKKDRQKGIIAVGQGEGVKNIFTELGVDRVISGGQSLNPSTSDFVDAIENIESDEIIILPNNKNIISAAHQAVSLSEKKIEVINTKSLPEAISALIVFNDNIELTELKEAMETEIKNVKTVEVTEAVKDSKVNGLNINKGDIIGIYNHSIESKGDNYHEVILDLFEKILEDEELVTIYYGQDINKEDVEQLISKLGNKYDFEIEEYNGGQPLYPYIISLE